MSDERWLQLRRRRKNRIVSSLDRGYADGLRIMVQSNFSYQIYDFTFLHCSTHGSL